MLNPIAELPVEPTSIIPNDGLIQNEQGHVVAIVTDIAPKSAGQPMANPMNTAPSGHQHLLSTDSNYAASILPPLIGDNESKDAVKPITEAKCADQQSGVAGASEAQSAQPAQPAVASRWSKENRVILKQLMSSLPPHDVGAALRVILDTFGVESSKLIRRGDFIELDLNNVTDDYILDSLWNYCAQMQFNIMSTLQMQQQQQQAQQQMQYQQVPQVHIPQQQQMQHMQYQQPMTQAHVQQQQHAVPVQMLQQQQQQYVQSLPPQMLPQNNQMANESMPQQCATVQNIGRVQQ